MAEKIAQKFEGELNCLICQDVFTNPKVLQCSHIYCQKCLDDKMVKDQQGQLSLTCPTCDQVTPVPVDGVAGLPEFQISHILEILKVKGSYVKAATVDPAVHNDACCPKPDKRYCQKCEEIICLKCAAGKHQSHEYITLDEAFDNFKIDAQLLQTAMDEQLATINNTMAHIDTHCAEISDQEETAEASLNETFNQIEETLSDRKTKLFRKLHLITARKLKKLKEQKDKLKNTEDKIIDCLSSLKNSLSSKNQKEVLSKKSALVKQVEQLTTTSIPDMLKPCTEADIKLSCSANLIGQCQGFGQITTEDALEAADPLDPSLCHVVGKGAEAAIVGETASVVLYAINTEGQPCLEPIHSLEIELVSEATGTRTQGHLERGDQGQYEIVYKPSVTGRHQLHIKVDGQHIGGSPLTIAAVKKLSTPTLSLCEVVEPWNVAVNQSGESVVVDRGGHCVSVFSPSGEKLRCFGKRGTGHGQFQSPRGVAVDNGSILVADTDNHRIQKFTVEGKFVEVVGTGSEGTGPLEFSQPAALAFNLCNSKIYVADAFNHRIQVLNHDLSFSSTFGRRGNDEGHFIFPRGVTCDSAGLVYVADNFNYRIQVFTADNQCLRVFWVSSVIKGDLGRPYSVAVDTNNVVYVTEPGHSRVSVFTSSGNLMTSFGSHGAQPGEFRSPRGIAIDSRGVVYVCDSKNHCVYVY